MAELHDAGPCYASLSHLATEKSLGLYSEFGCLISLVFRYCLVRTVQSTWHYDRSSELPLSYGSLRVVYRWRERSLGLSGYLDWWFVLRLK